MGPPDYSKTENANRISTNGGTWTVDRDGFVSAGAAAAQSELNAFNNIIVYINGVIAGFDGYGSGSQFTKQYRGTYPVKRGDVVKIENGTNGNLVNAISFCYFIPTLNDKGGVSAVTCISY